MKAKNTHRGTVTLFLVVVAVLISVVGANAQTGRLSGRFTLSYPVRWGQAMLPAGQYSIYFTSIHAPATIQSMDGKIAVFVMTARSADSEPGPGSLTIVTRGDERRVASLNLPDARVSLYAYDGSGTGNTRQSKTNTKCAAGRHEVVSLPPLHA